MFSYTKHLDTEKADQFKDQIASHDIESFGTKDRWLRARDLGIITPEENCVYWLTPDEKSPQYVTKGDNVNVGFPIWKKEIGKKFEEMYSPIVGEVEKVFLPNNTPVQAGHVIMQLSTWKDTSFSYKGGKK